MSVKIQYMVLGPVQTNVYFLINEETRECAVIDPADRADVIEGELKKLDVRPAAILLTHGHYDHIGAVSGLKQRYGAGELPVYAYREEERLLADGMLNHSALNGKLIEIRPDILLDDGQEFSVAGIDMKVIHTPGHTAGGCCYYLESEGVLFAGDTLFYGSIGRSDLPTGDGETLIDSIRKRLLILPEKTHVLPGHGQITTIEFEKRYNPFLMMERHYD